MKKDGTAQDAAAVPVTVDTSPPIWSSGQCRQCLAWGRCGSGWLVEVVIGTGISSDNQNVKGAHERFPNLNSGHICNVPNQVELIQPSPPR
jgi:hypothetical protein